MLHGEPCSTPPSWPRATSHRGQSRDRDPPAPPHGSGCVGLGCVWVPGRTRRGGLARESLTVWGTWWNPWQLVPPWFRASPGVPALSCVDFGCADMPLGLRLTSFLSESSGLNSIAEMQGMDGTAAAQRHPTTLPLRPLHRVSNISLLSDLA